MAAENFVGSEMDGYIDCHCHLADDMFNNVSNVVKTKIIDKKFTNNGRQLVIFFHIIFDTILVLHCITFSFKIWKLCNFLDIYSDFLCFGVCEPVALVNSAISIHIIFMECSKYDHYSLLGLKNKVLQHICRTEERWMIAGSVARLFVMNQINI